MNKSLILSKKNCLRATQLNSRRSCLISKCQAQLLIRRELLTLRKKIALLCSLGRDNLQKEMDSIKVTLTILEETAQTLFSLKKTHSCKLISHLTRNPTRVPNGLTRCKKDYKVASQGKCTQTMTSFCKSKIRKKNYKFL